MATYSLGQTQSQVLTVVKAWLQEVTALGNTAVVQGQPNRVAAPSATNYIVFTPIMRERLATNVVKYSSSNATLLDQHTSTQSTRFTVQVDVYGPASPDTIQILSTEFRSNDAVEYFAAAITDVTPLYTSEPRQIPFVDEGDQVQMRWSIDLACQIKPGVTTSQQFADSLEIGMIPVDVYFPPT
jgi:hypothetical protein